MTDPEAATAAVAAGVAAFGRIDVVVNNAGYASLVAVEDITLEDFRAQIDANLLGVGGLKLFNVACPVMALSPVEHGRWVAYSSSRGWNDYPQAGAGCVDP